MHAGVLKTVVALLLDSARRLVKGAAWCLKTMEKIDKGEDKKHAGRKLTNTPGDRTLYITIYVRYDMCTALHSNEALVIDQ